MGGVHGCCVAGAKGHHACRGRAAARRGGWQRRATSTMHPLHHTRQGATQQTFAPAAAANVSKTPPGARTASPRGRGKPRNRSRQQRRPPSTLEAAGRLFLSAARTARGAKNKACLLNDPMRRRPCTGRRGTPWRSAAALASLNCGARRQIQTQHNEIVGHSEGGGWDVWHRTHSAMCAPPSRRRARWTTTARRLKSAPPVQRLQSHKRKRQVHVQPTCTLAHSLLDWSPCRRVSRSA